MRPAKQERMRFAEVAEALQAMKDGLERLKRLGTEAIDD